MHFNLHSKLLVSLITLVTLSMGGMGYVLMNDADERLKEFQSIQVKSQLETLAESVIEPLLLQDYQVLENLVSVAMSDEYFVYVAIVSPDNTVIAHSDVNLVGKFLPTADQHTLAVIRKARINGRGIKEIILPIRFNNRHLANAHIAYYADLKLNAAGHSIEWLAMIISFTLVVMTLGSLFITRHLTQPVVALTSLVDRSVSDQKLIIDENILGRKDEVGALARSFKSMSDQLVDHVEELELQIQERDSARAASKTKSAFLANVSHELRTPLNVIIGYSELMLDGFNEATKAENEDDLNKIRGSALHLNSLIDDMLDLSKIEAGKLEVDIHSFEISSFIAGLKPSIDALLEKNNNRLIYNCSTGDECVMADPLRLNQILLNLLSNAAKFTHEGTVSLEIQSRGNNIEFSVTDTGIGMSSEQLSRVFEAFTQADAKTTIKYGGTGLGLTITRQLCEIMGGNIQASSEMGKGSTFTVIFPASAQMARLATSS